MNQIAQLSNTERSELFRIASDVSSMHPAIIEKDFWVCFVLDSLFKHSELRDKLLFKGGTSLSKGHDLISRFSENIDLIIDWRMLGYELDEPWNERSNTQQDKFCKNTKILLQQYLEESFAPNVAKLISEALGVDANITVDTKNLGSINFAYPKTQVIEAALPVARIELSPLSLWEPHEDIEINSYLSNNIENLSLKSVSVPTVMPARTFWEKITILHQEAHRPVSKVMPLRYARYYYDIYVMSECEFYEKAMQQIALLKRAAEFKMKFYRTPWAKFEDISHGKVKLVPSRERQKELAHDYSVMQDFIYGNIPSFDDVIERLSDIEEDIEDLLAAIEASEEMTRAGEKGTPISEIITAEGWR